LQEGEDAQCVGPGDALGGSAGFAGGDEAAHDFADAEIEAAGQMAGAGAEESGPCSRGGEGQGPEVVSGAVFAVVGKAHEDVAEHVVDEQSVGSDKRDVPFADGGFKIEGELDGHVRAFKADGGEGGGGVALGGREDLGATDAQAGNQAVALIEEMGEFVVKQSEGQVFIPVGQVAAGAVKQADLDGGKTSDHAVGQQAAGADG